MRMRTIGGVLVSAMALGSIAALSVAQTAQKPAFEVASIKPVKQEQCGFDPGNAPPPPSPGRLRMCTLAIGLINTAYLADMDPGQRSNVAFEGPDWVNTEWYEVEAKAEGEVSQALMRGPMLQVLLEDRFKARVHRVTRDGPVYALTSANGGTKFQTFAQGSCTQPGAPLAGKPVCGGYLLQMQRNTATLDITGGTTSSLAQALRLDRPVVDQTGITGVFNFHLEFARDSVTASMTPRIAPIAPSPATGADTATGAAAVTIFTALQEQLGLKLTAARGPRQYLVVDHIERPTEN